jgi:hypothetical protein
VPRVAFQAAMRAAAVQFLTDYKTAAGVKLQIYPGRPASLAPPTAFVDGIHEVVTYSGQLVSRAPTADVIVLFGLFDSAEAVAQKDAFADGFLDWALDRYHEAGANTLVSVNEVEDLPTYVNDWMSPERQNTYYAMRIGLEGLALSG